MALKTFNSESAANAGTTGGLTKGGDYLIGINQTLYELGNEQSSYLEFSGKAVDIGAEVNFLKLYMTQRNGKEHFESGFIDAMMGLGNIKELTEQLAVINGENKVKVPQFTGKQYIFKLQREDYQKTDGSIGWSMKVLNVFDPATRKTYSEIMKGEEAKAILREPQDKLLIPRSNTGTSSGSTFAPIDDDLPF